MTTTVTNFKAVHQHWDAKTQTWDDDRFVYVGRQNNAYHLPGSLFANPIAISAWHDRARVLARYRLYLDEHPEIVAAAKQQLKDKMLVCWCIDPAGQGDLAHRAREGEVVCHAQILAELVNQERE